MKKYILLMLSTSLIFSCNNNSVSEYSEDKIKEHKEYFNANALKLDLIPGNFDMPQDDEFWANLTKNEIDDFLQDIHKQQPPTLKNNSTNVKSDSLTYGQYSKLIIKEMFDDMMVFDKESEMHKIDSVYQSYAEQFVFIRMAEN